MKEQIAVVLLIFTFVFITHEYKSILESPLFPTMCIIVLLVVGFIYARKFKLNQTHVVSSPMFSRSNFGTLINGFTYNFSIYGIMYFHSIYFQESLHLSSLETGIKFLPLTISAMLISSFMSPFLVAKLGKAVTQQLCLSSIITGSSLLLILFGIAAVPGIVAVSFVILGFSGAIAPVLMNAAFSSTKEIYHNEISSLVNLARQMGSISGVVIVSILLDLFVNVMAIMFFLPLTMLISFIAYKYTVWNQKSETGSLDCDEVASSYISKS